MVSIADLATAGHLTTDFVFYVLTADNTIYALTIDDTSSLTNFFSNQLGATTADADAKLKKLTEISNRYFYRKYNALIKENSTDYQGDLIAFLKFIEEANLKVSLFEVDPAFSTHTKVELSTDPLNPIKRDICN